MTTSKGNTFSPLFPKLHNHVLYLASNEMEIWLTKIMIISLTNLIIIEVAGLVI